MAKSPRTWRRDGRGAPALLLVLVLSAAACGQGGDEPESGKTTLVIWAEGETAQAPQSEPDKRGRYGKYLEQQFEKEHGNVDVKLEYHGWDEELRQNLTTALLAGTAPDVIVGENYFQQYASLGALIPLDDVIGDIKGNLISGTIKAGQVDGKTYALPSFTGVFGLERNCQVIEKARLNCDKVPQTWDQLLKQAEEIKVKGNGQYYGYALQGPGGFSVGSVFRVAVLLGQAGATLCNANCTAPTFNDPKAIPVYEYLRSLNATTPPGLTFEPDEGKVVSQLTSGKVAFQMNGSWATTGSKVAGCADCRYSPFPLPSGGQATSVVVGNVLYAVLKQSKNIDVAKEWVKFLTTDGAQKMAWEATGRMPATRSALEAIRPTVSPADQQFIDILLNSELTVLPQWRKDPQRMWQVWNDAFTQVLNTDRSVADIMNKAQADAVAITNG